MSAFIPSKCDYNGEASPLYRIHSTNLGTFDYPFSCYRLAMYFQHSTSSGVPFYVNSIVDTVKKCMANPQISKNLVRFPVVPQKDFRYHSWCSRRISNVMFFLHALEKCTVVCSGNQIGGSILQWLCHLLLVTYFSTTLLIMMWNIYAAYKSFYVRYNFVCLHVCICNEEASNSISILRLQKYNYFGALSNWVQFLHHSKFEADTSHKYHSVHATSQHQGKVHLQVLWKWETYQMK